MIANPARRLADLRSLKTKKGVRCGLMTHPLSGRVGTL